jgi:hypothetical protein
MRRALLILIALVAAHAQAAISYRVKFESTDPQVSASEARVVADGAKLRADFEEREGVVHLYDSMLSDDGGKTWIAVNDQLQTWYRADFPPFIARSRNFTAMDLTPSAKKIQWSVKRGAESSRGELSYALEDNIGGTIVRSKVHATVEIWPMEGKTAASWPAAVPFETRIAAVDEQIARSPELLGGFPRKIVVTATRQYEGGAPTTDTSTMTVDEVRELPSVDAKRFVRPANYREQPPVVGAPGS